MTGARVTGAIARFDGFSDEEAYFAEREEQVVRRLEGAGYSRRQLLKAGAGGVAVLAGLRRLGGPALARAAAELPDRFEYTFDWLLAVAS